MTRAAFAVSRERVGVAVRTMSRWGWKNAAWSLFFLAPYIIGFTVFVGGPIIVAFALSFTKWDIITPPVVVGLDNYRSLLFEDRLLWTSVHNTVQYIALVVPLEILIAFCLAMLINQSLPGITVYRAIFFMPFVLSLASVGLLWSWLYCADFGLISFVFNQLHLPVPLWLTDSTWAMPAIAFTTLWRNAGYYMVIFLAGLQGIRRDLYEAASLDGAGPWQRLWHVTIPLLSPTTFFVLIIAVIWAFNVFDLIYIMTGQGRTGNIDATITLVYYLYEVGFRWYKMGMASAIAFILFGLTIVITIIQFVFQRRWVHYQ